MSVAEDFVTFLNATTAITAKVGSRIQQAAADITLPLPYICFRRRGRTESLTTDGVGGMIETQLDVECRGGTLDEAEDIADAVHAAVNGYRGTWGSRTICGAFVQDQDDDYEFLPAGSNNTEKTATLYVQVFSR